MFVIRNQLCTLAGFRHVLQLCDGIDFGFS
jgi:hypothetical protein